MTYQSTTKEVYLNNGDYSQDPNYPGLYRIYCSTSSSSSSDLDAINCISEAQLDLILAWFEDYCNLCFIAKGNAPSATGSINEGALVYGTPCADLKLAPSLTANPKDCLACIGIEDAELVLLEDSATDCAALEETTCLLAQDEAIWIAYINRFRSLVFP